MVHITIKNLASELAMKVIPDLFEWVMETPVKFTVMVLSFEASDDNSQWNFLETSLKWAIETELSRSSAIIVVNDDSLISNKSDSSALLESNYIISGGFTTLGDGIRIDIKCTKRSSRRILSSAQISLDTLNILNLSHEISVAMTKIKSAMLSDFRHKQKTLAIVAEPPITYFSAKKASNESKDLAKSIIYNTISKLRLMLNAAQITDSTNENLIVLSDIKSIEHYLDDFPAPSDIINDLDADYLIVLRIEDLGGKINISCNRYSYDPSRAAIAKYIFQGKEDKAFIGELLNKIVFKITGWLCGDNIVKRECDFCKSIINQSIDSLGSSRDIMQSAQMFSFVRKKSVGFRGGPSYNFNPDIFLGKKSRGYAEVFYSHLIPNPRNLLVIPIPPFNIFRFPHWLSNELEVSIGYTGNFKRRRITFGNGFVNYKLVFSQLQYESLPIVINGGFGIGGVGISYYFDPGEASYIGEYAFKSGTLNFACNTFIGIEFPILGDWHLQATLRYLMHPFTITDFQDLEFDETIQHRPVGNLNGLYFLGGLKYLFW